MSDLLVAPLSYGFFLRALAAGVLVGGMCGALSVFVVLRRMSYIGHGLAHSVLGGAAVGVALGYDVYVGAVAATLLSALLIDRVGRRRGLHADSAIGIVTTAMFALGVAVAVMAGSGRVSTEALLFGNILGVTPPDLAIAAIVGVAFAAVLVAAYKPLLLVTFDPDAAAVQGLPRRALESLLVLLTAAVVIASVRVLGVLLVAAAVVIPAALARLLTRSFGAMLGLGTVVGIVAAVVGLYGSYHLDVPSGPAIVLTSAGMFAAVFAGTFVVARAGLARARRPAPAGGR